MLDKWEANIPEEFRETAQLSIALFRDNSGEISLVYSAPESADERDAIIRHAYTRLTTADEYERLVYLRLKAKFEDE
jgi:hypothetical protein